MYVKNTGKKCIGFGSVIILPDEVKELPAGFDANHPTVKFYIAKKWLTPEADAGELKPKAQKAAKSTKDSKEAAETDAKAPLMAKLQAE